jgi:hypothetical protein
MPMWSNTRREGTIPQAGDRTRAASRNERVKRLVEGRRSSLPVTPRRNDGGNASFRSRKESTARRGSRSEQKSRQPCPSCRPTTYHPGLKARDGNANSLLRLGAAIDNGDIAFALKLLPRLVELPSQLAHPRLRHGDLPPHAVQARSRAVVARERESRPRRPT